jgi:hypothetical protein
VNLHEDVTQAVEQIHSRSGAWPTPAAIAGHIGVGTDDVRTTLDDLRRSGELVCRKRGSGRAQRREWMPAGER